MAITAMQKAFEDAINNKRRSPKVRIFCDSQRLVEALGSEEETPYYRQQLYHLKAAMKRHGFNIFYVKPWYRHELKTLADSLAGLYQRAIH